MEDLDSVDEINLGNGGFFPDRSINNISAISSNKNNSTKIGDTSNDISQMEVIKNLVKQ